MGSSFFSPASALSLGGGAINALSQRNALNSANNAELQAIGNQAGYGSKASGLVDQTTRGIANDNPATIANPATGAYVAQLRANGAGGAPGSANSALPAVPGANARYGKSVAAANANTQAYGNTTAAQMGNLDAATRMRQNEGLSMQTLGTGLNGLNQQSYAQNFVDQLRAQSAAQQNPWAALGGKLLGGAGSSLASSNNNSWGAIGNGISSLFKPAMPTTTWV